MAKKKSIYKIVFQNQGTLYELYARHVSHGEMYGFVEIADLTFGERSSVLVDPNDEKLKLEFEHVKRTFVPIHAVIRIDEVEQEGTAKIVPVSGDSGTVRPFPMPFISPAGPPGGGNDPGPGKGNS